MLVDKIKIIVFVFLIFICRFSVSYALEAGKVVVATAIGKEYVFNVEIADEIQEWEMGLMFRKELAEDSGMLFKMEDGIKRFWMKNTYIPLDIIFIDNAGVIKTIYKNAKPESLEPISSNVSVNTVLEVKGGTTDNLGIKEGDRVLSK